jgi:hypothetical protein
MRIPQTELYTEPLLGPSVLDVMPNVSFLRELGWGGGWMGVLVVSSKLISWKMCPTVHNNPTGFASVSDLQEWAAVHDCHHRHTQLPPLAIRDFYVQWRDVHPRVGAAHPADHRRRVRP